VVTLCFALQTSYSTNQKAQNSKSLMSVGLDVLKQCGKNL